MTRGVKGSQQPCKVDGCDRKARSKGLCTKHNAKLRMSGTLERIAGTDAYLARLRVARLAKRSELSKLDPTRYEGKTKGFKAKIVVFQVRSSAVRAKHTWDLTDVQAYKLLVGDCVYCGKPAGWPETRNGIDRVDSSKDYTIDNCVSACFKCNAAKGAGTTEEFMDWAKRLCKFQKFAQ